MPARKQKVQAPASQSHPENLKYPEGCRQIEEDLPKEELVRRLKALHNALSETDTSKQSDAETRKNYAQLATWLGQEQFVDHDSRDVQAYVACCIVDCLRLCSAKDSDNFPFEKDNGQIVFDAFLVQLAQLAKVGSNLFKCYHYLLESLSMTRALVAFVALDAEENLARAFRTLLGDAVPNATGSQSDNSSSQDDPASRVRDLIADCLAALVTEFDGLPRDVADDALACLIEPRRSTEPARSQLISNVVRLSGAALENTFQSLFHTLLLNSADRERDRDRGGSDRDRDRGDGVSSETRRVFSLILAVYTISPTALASSLPFLEIKLRSSDDPERLAAVRLVRSLLEADLAASQSAATSSRSSYDLTIAQAAVWSAFAARFNDARSDVRVECVRAIPTCFAYHAANNPGVRRDIASSIRQRAHDADEHVREETVRALITAAKRDLRTVDDDQLELIRERCLDKRFAIRKEALSGLVLLFKKAICVPSASGSSKRHGADGAGADEPNRAELARVRWVPDRLMKSYSSMFENPEDRMQLERMFKAHIVPYNLAARERMECLFNRFFILIDESSVRAFEAMLTAQVRTARLVRSTLCARMRAGAADATAAQETYQRGLQELARQLGEPLKQNFECARRIFEHLFENAATRKATLRLLSPRCLCSQVEENAKVILTQVRGLLRGNVSAEQALANQMSVAARQLIEKFAQVLFDPSSVLELIRVIRARMNETLFTSNVEVARSDTEADENIADGDSKGGKLRVRAKQREASAESPEEDEHAFVRRRGHHLLEMLARIVPGAFSSREVCDEVIAFCLEEKADAPAGNKAKARKRSFAGCEMALRVARFAGVALDARLRCYLFEHLVESIEAASLYRRSPRAAKYAIRCLEVLVNEPLQREQTLPEESEEAREDSITDDDSRVLLERCRTQFDAFRERLFSRLRSFRFDSPTAVCDLVALTQLARSRNLAEQMRRDKLFEAAFGLLTPGETGSGGRDWGARLDAESFEHDCAGERVWHSNLNALSSGSQLKVTAFKFVTQVAITLFTASGEAARRAETPDEVTARVITSLTALCTQLSVKVNDSPPPAHGPQCAAERSYLHLAAANCLLKLARAEIKLPPSCFRAYSYAFLDSFLEAKQSLFNKLSNALRANQLSAQFLAPIALLGGDTTPRVHEWAKSTVKPALVSLCCARRAFVKQRAEARTRQANAEKDSTRQRAIQRDAQYLLGANLPEASLSFALHLLAHSPNFDSVSDLDQLAFAKRSAWFFIEALTQRTDDNLTYLKRAVEHIRTMRDATFATPNVEIDRKLHAVSDIAMNLLTAKTTTSLSIKQITAEPLLPQAYFVKAEPRHLELVREQIPRDVVAAATASARPSKKPSSVTNMNVSTLSTGGAASPDSAAAASKRTRSAHSDSSDSEDDEDKSSDESEKVRETPAPKRGPAGGRKAKTAAKNYAEDDDRSPDSAKGKSGRGALKSAASPRRGASPEVTPKKATGKSAKAAARSPEPMDTHDSPPASGKGAKKRKSGVEEKPAAKGGRKVTKVTAASESESESGSESESEDDLSSESDQERVVQSPAKRAKKASPAKRQPAAAARKQTARKPARQSRGAAQAASKSASEKSDSDAESSSDSSKSDESEEKSAKKRGRKPEPKKSGKASNKREEETKGARAAKGKATPKAHESSEDLSDEEEEETPKPKRTPQRAGAAKKGSARGKK